MQTKVVIFEFRPPQTKEEKKLHGCAITEGDVTRIFINSQQKPGEKANTIFHELAHTYFHWMENVKVSDKDQENVCRLVGDITEPCFRKCFK